MTIGGAAAPLRPPQARRRRARRGEPPAARRRRGGLPRRRASARSRGRSPRAAQGRPAAAVLLPPAFCSWARLPGAAAGRLRLPRARAAVRRRPLRANLAGAVAGTLVPGWSSSRRSGCGGAPLVAAALNARSAPRSCSRAAPAGSRGSRSKEAGEVGDGGAPERACGGLTTDRRTRAGGFRRGRPARLRRDDDGVRGRAYAGARHGVRRLTTTFTIVLAVFLSGSVSARGVRAVAVAGAPRRHGVRLVATRGRARRGRRRSRWSRPSRGS